MLWVFSFFKGIVYWSTGMMEQWSTDKKEFHILTITPTLQKYSEMNISLSKRPSCGLWIRKIIT
jgi:hypothetical protein